jgi:hypothetical protein
LLLEFIVLFSKFISKNSNHIYKYYFRNHYVSSSNIMLIFNPSENSVAGKFNRNGILSQDTHRQRFIGL